MLSKIEAIYIAKKLSGQTDLPENFVAEMKYFNLTGEKFVHEKRMHFTKNDDPQG